MKQTPLLTLLSLVSQAFADLCNCGYSINHTDSMQFGLFTELEETDFFHTSSVDNTVRIGTTRWDAQVYNKTAEQVRRLLGFSKQLGNVIANPLPEGIWGGPPASVGDAGLQLWVRHALEDDLVPVAGIDDAFNPRDTSQMIYGSFRAAIKFSGMNGTRGAFSWQSASEERRQYIGIEFASSETDTIQVVAYDRPAANGSNCTDEVSGSDESEATATGSDRRLIM